MISAVATANAQCIASDSVSGLQYEVTLPVESDDRLHCECPALRYRNGGEDARGPELQARPSGAVTQDRMDRRARR